MITVEDVLAEFPGTTDDDEYPFRRIAHVDSWTKGSFRGGPLDGQRHNVPKQGPAFVRWHDDESVYWYSIKPKTLRTYVYLGITAGEGFRSASQRPTGSEQQSTFDDDAIIEPVDTVALGMQITVIAGGATSGYIEIRALDPDGDEHRREWIDVRDPDRTHKAAEFIERIRATHSVYIGCAPRIRQRGTLEDVAQAHCLWGDSDSPESTARLFELTPAPTCVLTSGRPGHTHFFYALRFPIPATWVKRANRRLALALGGDMAPTHAAGTLRPVGSVNRRTGATTRCAYADLASRYPVKHVVGHLPDESARRATPAATGSHTGITGLLTAIRNAPAGTARGYNATLHWAACRCAEHIDRGELDRESAYEALYEVALEVDLGEHATRATLRSAGLA